MKYLLTILCCCICLSLSAQSYYVAIVKGKVYYEDVLLKPKTKIELKGNFRFTTKDDYVKVSGPNGIHTIRPKEKEGGGYEFLRAVTQELFPAAKPRGSFVLSTWINPGDILSIHAENEFEPDYFVAGEQVTLKGHLKPWQQKKLYWVSQIPGGRLLREPATVVKGNLVLTHEPFANAAAVDSIVQDQLYLFFIKDWLAFRSYADKVGIDTLFWVTNPDAQPGKPYLEDIRRWQGFDPTKVFAQKTNASGRHPFGDIISLGSIPVTAVLPQEPFLADMLHYQLASEETSVYNFMLGGRDFEREDYSNVVWEAYGRMNFHRVIEVYLGYIYEHRKDDPRIRKLWELNGK